jgi:hypothetical protein
VIRHFSSRVRIAAYSVSFSPRSVPIPINLHFPINRHRHEPVGRRVRDRDDLMPVTRLLSLRRAFNITDEPLLAR